jgi:hypothetical protein
MNLPLIKKIILPLVLLSFFILGALAYSSKIKTFLSEFGAPVLSETLAAGWTNVCGVGPINPPAPFDQYNITETICKQTRPQLQGKCDLSKQECTSGEGERVHKFVCEYGVEDNLHYCTTKNELYQQVGANQTLSVGDTQCNKVVQIDVTPDCDDTNQDVCPAMDSFTWYTGACAEEPTISCDSLTATATDSSGNAVDIQSLPVGFTGRINLVCNGSSTVKPITTMEFNLTTTIGDQSTTQSKVITGSEINSVSACSDNRSCYTGATSFDITGGAQYKATSKVCNEDNLCSPN